MVPWKAYNKLPVHVLADHANIFKRSLGLSSLPPQPPGVRGGIGAGALRPARPADHGKEPAVIGL
jgi:hypothetical protein